MILLSKTAFSGDIPEGIYWQTMGQLKGVGGCQRQCVEVLRSSLSRLSGAVYRGSERQCRSPQRQSVEALRVRNHVDERQTHF